jgi:hypothetical protein
VANYRILTPSFPAILAGFRLPGFDASKTEDRILKTGSRSASKWRRQNPAVSVGQKQRRQNPAVSSFRLNFFAIAAFKQV